ncbi:protein phosphatase 2C domain-containing protein [Streptomyces sp. NPDC091280]|uniref:protein phosphatase 2C domain-containing protein n=1 Tax=Streptomyces sp. NPDC091280 TaxID=3365984 RepID=UPI00381B767A
MSQQGGKPPGHEDDWWGQLYDDSTDDTGPTATADSLEDRFASAAGTVGEGARPDPGTGGTRPAPGPVDEGQRAVLGPGVPAPRPGAAGALLGDTADADAAGHRPADAPGHRPADTPGHRPADTSGHPSAAVPGDDSSPSPTGQGVGTAPPLGSPPFPAPLPPPPPPPLAPVSPAAPVPAAPPGSRAEAPFAAPVRAPRPNLPALVTPPPPPPAASPALDYVGSGPPTYDAEPTALPAADPDDLDDLVADTVLDGARYGSSTLRAASVRGDSARFRGEPRRDSLLTARFGVGEQALVLVAMATGARATPGAHRAAAEACQWIGRAVGRSHARLAEDIRAARRGDLKSGLHRLTDRSLGKLRASAAEQGIDPDEYAATLRCLLLPAHPECRTRVFFGVGPGGLFRLRDGEWQDIEPTAGEAAGEAVVGFGSQPAETPEGDRLTMDLGIPTPPSPYEPAPEPPREPFRFRASVARPGDTLLMCTGGLAEPLRGEPELSAHLAGRWSAPAPPGLAAFLADTQVRVKGYADDRTAAAVWEA